MDKINIDEILTQDEKEDLKWFMKKTIEAITDLDNRLRKLEEKNEL